VKFNKSRAPGLLIALGLTLVFLSLVIQRGPPNILGPLRLFPKNTVHWFGWIGSMVLMITSIFSINRWSIVKKPSARFQGCNDYSILRCHDNSPRKTVTF
jgi:hypothetical protein